MTNYPIDPFVGDQPLDLQNLMDELTAARQAIHDLSVKPRAKDAEIEQKAVERAKHYTLAENARHPTIKTTAEAVIKATGSFGDVCNNMDLQHAVVTKQVRDRIALHMLTVANQSLQQLGVATAEAAQRSDPAAMRSALQAAAAGLDTTSKEFLGSLCFEALLAGSLIDVGNAFTNLDATRHVAMQRYADGKAPRGWTQHLPRPVKAVFTEGTCIALEKGVEVFLGQGIPGVIPMGAAVVGVGRLAFEIRGERRHIRLAFRRADVDDMLELADQLNEAISGAQQHLETVNKVDLAIKQGPL